MKNHLSATASEPSTERGFVSIFSVLIIMTVLTLILVGFSSLIRQAQRRTLDNQLSTQAFYAAETGVNDAVKAIKATPSLSKTVCTGDPTHFRYTLDASLNVGYTCVLINPSAPDVKFDSVPVEGNGSPKVFNLESAGDVFQDMSISWDGIGTAAGNTAVNALAGTYPNILDSAANWGNGLGVVRIDMVPVDTGVDANAYDRADLAKNSYTFFLVPFSGASGSTNWSVDSQPTGQAQVLPIKCPGTNTSAGRCQANLTMNNTGYHHYIVRMQAVYNTVKVTMFDFTDPSGNVLTLKDGQAIIDVTGRANDVFRRIQVRVPLLANGITSPFGLETATSICKLLEVGPSTTTVVSSMANLLDRPSCAIPTTASP